MQPWQSQYLLVNIDIHRIFRYKNSHILKDLPVADWVPNDSASF